MFPIPYAREAIGAVAAAGIMLVLYEGLPVPFLRDVPIIEHLVQGRVESEREKAAAAAREGYVREVELTAAQAELDKVNKQLGAARRSAEGYAEILAEWQTAYRDAEEQDRVEDENYERELAARGRSYELDDADIQHLMRQSAARRAANHRRR